MSTTGSQSLPAAKAGQKIPFRERFKAWWEGYELAPLPAPPKKAIRPEHAVRYEGPKLHWETSRIRLVQEVWGEGFSTPGDEEPILHLTKALGLDPAKSVLDLGAGLGGAARVMSAHFGVWVTALEADAALAEAGMALSTKAGMANKAPVEHFDPTALEVKQKSIDCVFSKEFLFTVEDKTKLLSEIEDILKPRGQILFTDFMLAKPHLRTPELEAWQTHEPLTPHPWAVEDYQDALTELHLDIRICDDMTDVFHRLVTHGWADFIGAAARRKIDKELAGALVDEVELWARRMNAIEKGHLKVYRVHALKKDTNRLMSDW